MARGDDRAGVGIVRLAAADGARYARVRRRMLEGAPWAFDGALEGDPWLEGEWVAAALGEGECVVFAARGADGELDGVVTLAFQRAVKFAHRARIGALWVEPHARGRGIGRALVRAALHEAHGRPGVEYVDLGVSANSPEALALYESFGFVVWGREPEATRLGGVAYDELHLALRLRAR